MEPLFQDSRIATAASASPLSGGNGWSFPSRVTANDNSSAELVFVSGGFFGSELYASAFGLRKLPDAAVVTGIQITIKGTNTGCYGDLSLNLAGSPDTPVLTLNTTYGGSDEMWGQSAITQTQLDNLQVTLTMGDINGGDGYATIDHITATVFYRIELEQPYTPELQTTYIYKSYSKTRKFLGILPNVTTDFAFTQDINSSGSKLVTRCGIDPKPVEESDTILDSSGNTIQSNDGSDILSTFTTHRILPGNHPDDAMFKNGNRLKVWRYDRWHPNGVRAFSGQINRVRFSIGSDEGIEITTYSDGMDLDQYVARGFPFAYTLDQQHTNDNGLIQASRHASDPSWKFYGQSFTTGAGVTNVGEIQLRLSGSATVNITLYGGGNPLATVTKVLQAANPANATAFAFSNLPAVTPETEYFFGINLPVPGESIEIVRDTTAAYTGGTAHESIYSGFGGGSFQPVGFDLWFKTSSGSPSTTTTYTNQDPVTGTANGILLDYNSRGGRIIPRSLVAAGYTLTQTFNSATVYTALLKILKACPPNYYLHVDIADSAIDILPVSAEAELVVTVGKDVSKLDFSQSIEGVKNDFLFTGGVTGQVGGFDVNLFKEYYDDASISNYEPRLAQGSDNRVTQLATANAIGESFIDENSEEVLETPLTLLASKVDIMKFTPGKSIGFRNTGMFTDDLVLKIVRREFSKDSVSLFLGAMPLIPTTEIERIKRELLEEQTVNNPVQPT